MSGSHPQGDDRLKLWCQRIGKTLCAERKLRGISRNAMSKRSLLAYNTVRLIEAGKSDFRFSSIVLMCEVMGLDVLELVETAAVA